MGRLTMRQRMMARSIPCGSMPSSASHLNSGSHLAQKPCLNARWFPRHARDGPLEGPVLGQGAFRVNARNSRRLTKT
jgi:hypothetical protein